MVIVCLVEEDILSILDLMVGSVLLEDSGGTDAMFLAKLLPKLGSDWVVKCLLWFPHWPIWMVMISRGINSNYNRKHSNSPYPTIDP